jgi:hypothetical protein
MIVFQLLTYGALLLPASSLSILKRRNAIVKGIGTLPFVSLIPSLALAAPPITEAETQNVGSRVLRMIRPKPPKVLRARLDEDFAVLLMRSSYNALDQLDCVAMDQFQRDFFITRQAEYGPYIESLGPGLVQQGDLRDPYYFDFISFAQFLTINREFIDAPSVFEESQPVDVGENEPQKFVKVVVRRDPSLINDRLAEEHGRIVGDAILNRLDEVFGDTAASLPKYGTKPNPVQLLSAYSQLVKLFLVNGFAWDGNADLVSSGSPVQIEMVLQSPATLWSGQCLRLQRVQLTNDFL